MFHRRPIGEVLVSQGKLTNEQVEEALSLQVELRRRIGEIFILKGWLTVDDLDAAQAEQFEVPYEPLTQTISRDVLDLIPGAAALTFGVIPVASDEFGVHVAMNNPDDLEAIDWMRVHTRRSILPRFSATGPLERALAFYYGGMESAPAQEIEPTEVDTDRFSLEEAVRASEEPPVVGLVNTLFAEAIKSRASDIHLEPMSGSLEIRYRIDGMLRRVKTLPKSMQAACLSRVKIMADLDISERRLPQDGRLGLRINNRQVDMRVSTLPTRHGERIVLRVLDKAHGVRPLDDLGFSPRNLTLLKKLIKQPHGLVLVTGPTGSGKTTTLYGSLMEVKSDTRNILTVEDPVELELDGIGQSQVNERIGLTFAAQLRSLLRQDPDVILVGEIRDKETAEIACRAAMTGHLVLSTLHTNDAPSAIPRLIDMGVEPFLINSALRGVVAQRLVRSLCPTCKRPSAHPRPCMLQYGVDGAAVFYEPVGCEDCSRTGFHGRMPVHELMVIDDGIQELTSKYAQTSQIRDAAISTGMVLMELDALRRVGAGLTSFDEATAHTNLATLLDTHLEAA